jgi:hypothetical protein
MFALRDILQYSSDLNTAIARVERTNRTNSIFAGIGGMNTDTGGYEFRILEYAHDNVTVWDDRTGPSYGNHTRKDGLVYIDKHTQPDPGPGAWCLDTLMEKYYGSFNATNLIDIASIYQTGDAQVAVYDFDTRFMYVTYPSVSGWPDSKLNVTKAYDRQPTRFDMESIFAEPIN